MRMDIVVCNNWKGRAVETAATDGRRIFVNPEYFMSLNEKIRISLVIHEVSHVALAHHLRREMRLPDKWNEATDYVVNEMIEESGGAIGQDWLRDSKYSGWSAERIYGEIEEGGDDGSDKGEGEGEGGEGEGETPGSPGGGEVGDEGSPSKQPGEVWDATDDDGKELSDAGKQIEERNLARDVHTANQVQRSAGTSTGANYERRIGEVLSPSADWTQLLSEFWTGTGDPINETWSRPNRRYMPAGIWAPSVDDGGVDWVVIGVDVSGSIMQRELDAFISQINALRMEVPAKRISVVPFNSVVLQTQVVDIDQYDDVPSSFNTGGGTRFDSITSWVRRLEKGGDGPDSLIIFTDLGDSRYGTEPSCPVLWASTDPVYTAGEYTNRPPFGDLIEIELR